jgi:hypothetical protein
MLPMQQVEHSFKQTRLGAWHALSLGPRLRKVPVPAERG